MPGILSIDFVLRQPHCARGQRFGPRPILAQYQHAELIHLKALRIKAVPRDRRAKLTS